jgi:hypothetical protein
VATAASAFVLAVAVGTASGSTFTIVERSIRSTWSAMSFEAAGLTVRCPVTLEGSMAEGSFIKRALSRIGSVTRATIGTCSGGAVRVLSETLPWAIQYASFTGTLPNITSGTLRAVGAAMQIAPTGAPACLARTSEEAPLRLIAERETSSAIVTGMRIDEEAQIPLSGEFLCSLSRGRVAGRGSVTALGATTEVMLLLGEEEHLLQGVTAEERGAVHPIADLELVSPTTLGVRSITNSNPLYEIRILEILKIEGHPENFTILGGLREDCAVGKVLLPRSANACNIRIGFTSGTRTTETKVLITYSIGALAPFTAGQGFKVIAR